VEVTEDECIHGLTPETCSLCKQPRIPTAGIGRGPRGASSSRKTPENSVDFFGHPWAEWFRMCDIATADILTNARAARTTTYGDLWSAVEAGLGQSISAVGDHPATLRVDRFDGLLAELDTRHGDRSIRVAHLGQRRAADHDVEFRESEDGGVVLVDVI
jgi:hypothetical protein